MHTSLYLLIYLLYLLYVHYYSCAVLCFFSLLCFPFLPFPSFPFLCRGFDLLACLAGHAVPCPAVHKDPDELNRISVRVTVGANSVDAGCYSEPIMYLRALLIYEAMRPIARDSWLYKNGFVRARFKSFRSTALSMLQRVQNVLDARRGVPSESPGRRFVQGGGGTASAKDRSQSTSSWLSVKLRDLDDLKLNSMRLILVWCSTCKKTLPCVSMQ